MNEHTPGPLKVIPGSAIDAYDSIVISETRGALGYSPPLKEDSAGYTRFTQQDARLLAASYSQYDKVAREWLGVDATELAEKMNLLTILREWAFFVKVHGTYGTLEASDVTRDLLAEKFKLEKVSR